MTKKASSPPVVSKAQTAVKKVNSEKSLLNAVEKLTQNRAKEIVKSSILSNSEIAINDTSLKKQKQQSTNVAESSSKDVAVAVSKAESGVPTKQNEKQAVEEKSKTDGEDSTKAQSQDIRNSSESNSDNKMLEKLDKTNKVNSADAETKMGATDECIRKELEQSSNKIEILDNRLLNSCKEKEPSKDGETVKANSQSGDQKKEETESEKVVENTTGSAEVENKVNINVKTVINANTDDLMSKKGEENASNNNSTTTSSGVV